MIQIAQYVQRLVAAASEIADGDARWGLLIGCRDPSTTAAAATYTIVNARRATQPLAQIQAEVAAAATAE
jgi:hypothetical protein